MSALLMHVGQGTWQFMSACLVEDASATHTFKDDLESSFEVLLWIVVMFSESSLSIKSCSNFIRGTFESAPGGEGKWSVLVLQQKLKEGLFPSQPSLYQLLKDLADLFAYDYYTPGDSEEWNLLVFTEEPSAREKALMEELPIFCHKKSVERLQSHDYVIKHFATHLNSSTWPENDTAMMQLLMKINCWGEEGSSNIGILKLKHILGCMLEEEEEERSHKKMLPKKWTVHTLPPSALSGAGANLMDVPPPKHGGQKKLLPPAPEAVGPSCPIAGQNIMPKLPLIPVDAPKAKGTTFKGTRSKHKSTIQAVATDPSNVLAAADILAFAPDPKPRKHGTASKSEDSQKADNTNTVQLPSLSPVPETPAPPPLLGPQTVQPPSFPIKCPIPHSDPQQPAIQKSQMQGHHTSSTSEENFNLSISSGSSNSHRERRQKS
ncbi:hypothetical protein EDC04DRAFT_2902334 [Pisolithus marmoratus]|nr:hypothetical protein EDC04DRAFT_2902334 [Pisolithus marmoratus]